MKPLGSMIQPARTSLLRFVSRGGGALGSPIAEPAEARKTNPQPLISGHLRE